MTKLLLVDDDEELCAELAQVLEAEGFEVDMAFDGLRGVQCLQEKSYHLIILDLKLPRLDGYGVLKEIRKTAQPVKVLVLSGKPLGGPLFKEEKTLIMADAVMNKPFIVQELLQQIQALTLPVVEKNQ